jgi:hypothetical protein
MVESRTLAAIKVEPTAQTAASRGSVTPAGSSGWCVRGWATIGYEDEEGPVPARRRQQSPKRAEMNTRPIGASTVES